MGFNEKGKNQNMKILDYRFICHKLPERSFFYKGKQFPICARCTGILIGYLIALLMAFFIEIPLMFSFVLLIPIGIDGIGQYLGKWTSTNTRRLITGILAGIATIYIIIFIGKLGYSHGVKLQKILRGL
ncbi:MAG TPA: hypothetical protein DDZ33_06875 [Clostridium sp.]|nr:hypothetical protein [Clostridium sp.]